MQDMTLKHTEIDSSSLLFKKKLEESLSQTRQNYETFFNSINDFLFVLSEEGNIIHTNSTVINRLGYTVTELIGKSFLFLHPEERREEAGRIVSEMLTGKAEFCPVPIITKTGRQIPVETRVTRGVWNGKPVLFGVTKDISKIQLSEEKFSKSFFLNPSAAGLSDLVTGEYVEVNDAFCRLLGFTHEEVIGKSASQLGILTQELKNSILKRVSADGKVKDVESELRAKNGEIKCVLLSAENIYIQDKAFRYTVVHDITDRKKAEEELSDKQTLLRTIIDLIPDAVYVKNLHGQKILANPKEVQLSGKASEEEVLGKTDLELYPDSEEVKRAIEEDVLVIESRKSILDVEGKLTNTNGEIRWLLGSKVPLINAKDEIIGIVGLNHDITERKRMEELVEQLANELKVTLDTVSAGISHVKDRKVVWANHAYDTTFGYAAGESIGVETSIYYPDRASFESFEAEAYPQLLGGNTFTSEIKMKKKDGMLFWCSMTGRLVNAHNHAEGSIWMIQDISERKRVEEEINTKNEELVKLNSEKDKFFSIISHDLRSPFQGFIGMTGILAEGINTFSLDELSEVAHGMNDSANKLYKLLLNLLEWAKMKQGRIEFEPSEYSLVDEVSKNVEMIEKLGQQKGINIKIEIPNNHKIYADQAMLDSLMRNLLSNAVKFTTRGGHILVSSKETENKMIEVSVTDNGVGMSESYIQKLFKIGEKIGKEGTAGEASTGLGLLLCKEFVEKHGGSIWVKSEEGKGSTFYFTLPQKKLCKTSFPIGT